METCAGCGFALDDLLAADVSARTTVAALAIAAHLDAAASIAAVRPSPDRWSMLEYGAHVRDVCTALRDWIVVGLVEDGPVPKPVYGAVRVELGLYAGDAPDVVADELAIVAELFARTFDALTPAQLERTIAFGSPEPTARTLLWVAAQVVHESEHHLADVAEDRRRLEA